MAKQIKIDFVSDISCPWCAIGMKGLQDALATLGDEIEADVECQPFELDANLPKEGISLAERLASYGLSLDRMAAQREALRERAANAGFPLVIRDDRRLYNTFDAHRLLCWAREQGKQVALKQALLAAYHGEGLDLSDFQALARMAASVGLSADEALAVLETGRYADEVRSAEELWRARGISSVPSVIINNSFLISGGQPAAAFETALREFISEEQA
jgi:predicted DsbA family dithiol-disulfide isomerase